MRSTRRFFPAVLDDSVVANLVAIPGHSNEDVWKASSDVAKVPSY